MSVVLDWYGCATFRLRTAGLSIFLDAYIDRTVNAPGTGLCADDIDECDWIVVGHSHFDHLYGAERIALNTGAKIIGSYETVRVMEQAGVPVEQMICVSGGETVDLGFGVSVSAFPSLHSCVWTHGGMPASDEVCLGDLGVSWQEQQTRYEALVKTLTTELDPAAIEHIVSSSQGARGDGGALVYVFDMPEGRILYQDTSGYWTGILEGIRPDVAILAAAGRGNIDGQPIQGSLAQFVGGQAARVGAPRIVLCHHDNWLPGFSIETDLDSLRRELEEAVPGVQLLELDYLDGTEILPPRDKPGADG